MCVVVGEAAGAPDIEVYVVTVESESAFRGPALVTLATPCASRRRVIWDVC